MVYIHKITCIIFIGYLKIISGQDVLGAMTDMEFERFVEPLQASLEGIITVLQKFRLNFNIFGSQFTKKHRKNVKKL